MHYIIPIHQTNRISSQSEVFPRNLNFKRTIITIKREREKNEINELPRVMNLNPRSLYHRADEFSKLVELYNIQLVGVSESWERENMPLKELINIPGFRVLTNVCQRSGRGGKPALIISEKHFHIIEISPNPITVPAGVEAVWALLRPKVKSEKV